MTIWAIWKSRNKNSILDQDVAPSETREVLKELIRDLIRKSWNATRFMEGGRRLTRQRAFKTLWADGRFADFNPKTGPSVDFTQRDMAGYHRRISGPWVGQAADCPTGK